MERLARFLVEHRQAILEQWRRRARELPAAKALSRSALEDHVPEILEALANAIVRKDASEQALHELPHVHASERWAQDYDLRQVVTEYRLLRRVILDEYSAHGTDPGDQHRERLLALAVLNENIDHAITEAVDEFYQERVRAADWAIGVLGHDLRNPLSVTAMNAQLLLRHEPPLDPRARDIAQGIRRTTRSMERLVGDLLDVARWRGGRPIPLNAEELELRLLVLRVMEEFQLAHPERTLEVAGEACHGRWDPDRLQQVVANLLSNAIKYGADPVRVEIACGATEAVVTVCSGGGIPEDMRPMVFKPFFTSDQQRGTGLGLFISREIARAHGGELQLVDDDPALTCLRLRLPRA